MKIIANGKVNPQLPVRDIFLRKRTLVHSSATLIHWIAHRSRKPKETLAQKGRCLNRLLNHHHGMIPFRQTEYHGGLRW